MESSTTSTEGTRSVGWRFNNTYAQLPDALFASAQPAAMPEPRVSILNSRLAKELGLDFEAITPEAMAAMLAGQALPSGALPIAQAYAGHQYGGFTMLGDGRAILLGEHRTPSGELADIQLKGAGRTQFSRGGDGRAALGPMLREYIISEAMHAVGIPTTRCLAVVTTGESVFRTTALRGAVLTRVAASHIRVGTFEYAARRDVSTLSALADYTIDRHYPELATSPRKYSELLRAVADRQASLVAQWQSVGFIHGVMNTDNMAISGETIDYGPCAFINAYDPATVFSSIDHGGRYAYGNQPNIAQWNLARFAETLLPLLDADQEKAVAVAMEALNEFAAMFQRYWLAGMRKKLGFWTEQVGDAELVRSLLDWMHKARADFTNTFLDLTSGEPLTNDSYQEADFRAWHARWRERLGQDNQKESFALMRTVNPVVVPRNHRVEEALVAAEERDDFSIMHRLLEVLASPYQARDDIPYYQEAPIEDGSYRTFCGT